MRDQAIVYVRKSDIDAALNYIASDPPNKQLLTEKDPQSSGNANVNSAGDSASPMEVDSGRTKIQPDEMEIHDTLSQLTTPSSTACGKSARVKKTTATGVIDLGLPKFGPEPQFKPQTPEPNLRFR
jgi:hypothetical protein